MSKTKIFLLLSVLFIAAIVFAGWQLHPKKGSPVYVTSQTCQQCHQDSYESWNKTLHPRMFRPVKNDDDILGDFSSNDPVVTFSKDDIDYVVGNRWEQIYITMIDGEYYPLPAKWYVKQKQWAAYKVDTWHKTKMSEKCNGCHVTGFDPATYEFSEFGVGCEACHGPGSKHVVNKKMSTGICKICHKGEKKNQKDIIRSTSSTVCGQCHNRGKNTPFSSVDAPVFNFPVQYVPGTDLGQVFTELTPAKDKNNKYWWGNGVAKARHQEFADWGKSKHSKALTLLKQNHTKGMGELQDFCLECHSTDYQLADKDDKPTVRSAHYGITCVGCHNPHTMGEHVVRERNQPCQRCHEPKQAACVDDKNINHFPCPADKVECVDCHMPYVVKSGGWYSIRGHAFIIVSPLESKDPAMPTSCQNGGCHQDRSPEWIQQEYRQFYGDTAKEK